MGKSPRRGRLGIDAGRIWFRVTDDGPGVRPEELTNLTRRGWRLDSAKPGTGLGLSIVREIATVYDMDFELHNDEALGGLCAEISLMIPMTELGASAEMTQRRSRASRNMEATSFSLRENTIRSRPGPSRRKGRRQRVQSHRTAAHARTLRQSRSSRLAAVPPAGIRH